MTILIVEDEPDMDGWRSAVCLWRALRAARLDSSGLPAYDGTRRNKSL